MHTRDFWIVIWLGPITIILYFIQSQLSELRGIPCTLWQSAWLLQWYGFADPLSPWRHHYSEQPPQQLQPRGLHRNLVCQIAPAPGKRKPNLRKLQNMSTLVFWPKKGGGGKSKTLTIACVTFSRQLIIIILKLGWITDNACWLL